MDEYTLHHKDGSVWAKGWKQDGVDQGYWEWFRKDGTRLRSGYFDRGKAVGEWITYDKQGEVYKVTLISEVDQAHGDLPTSIGGPATGALKLEGLIWLKDIARKTDKELLNLHGVGPKAVRILREAIAKERIK